MKFKFEFGDLFKIPNILCYIRIAMVPLFCYVYFTAEEPQDFIWAAVIVMLSGITDFLDGQIARRCNMITDLGKIIDPLADKFMQLAMVVCLTLKIKYMVLLVAYLIIKELVMLAAGAYVLRKCKKRLNGAKWYGKICTAVLYVVMLILIALPSLNTYMQAALILVCASVLTLAFVMYIRIYLIMIRDAKSGNQECNLY